MNRNRTYPSQHLNRMNWEGHVSIICMIYACVLTYSAQENKIAIIIMHWKNKVKIQSHKTMSGLLHSPQRGRQYLAETHPSIPVEWRTEVQEEPWSKHPPCCQMWGYNQLPSPHSQCIHRSSDISHWGASPGCGKPDHCKVTQQQSYHIEGV